MRDHARTAELASHQPTASRDEDEAGLGLLSQAQTARFAGGVAQAAAPATDYLTKSNHDLPPFITGYRGLFYQGLPRVDETYDDAGSGKAIKNWYRDIAVAAHEAWPAWVDLGQGLDVLQEMHEDTWAGIGKSADAQQGKLAKLNAKSHEKLRMQLNAYLAAEKEVDAARRAMGAATGKAAAAAHDFNAAIAVKEAEKSTQEADKKEAEVKTLTDDRAAVLKGLTTILGIVTDIGDFATGMTPWGAIKTGLSIAGKMADVIEGPEHRQQIEQLSAQIAVLRGKARDGRLTAANEAAMAAAARVNAAKEDVLKARARLTAAKGRVGTAVQALHHLEELYGGGTNIFGRIDEASEETTVQVGTDLTSLPKEQDRKGGKEGAKSPAEVFGEGSVRALAMQLLATLDSGAFVRGEEMLVLLRQDWYFVQPRFAHPYFANSALKQRWDAVWKQLFRYVGDYFMPQRSAIVAALHEVLLQLDEGVHLGKRREILTKIATDLGVVAE